MRDRFRIMPTSLAVVILAATGCQSTSTNTGEHSAAAKDGAVLPSLVTLGDQTAITQTASGWEIRRNDRHEPARVTPDRAGVTFIEIKHHEQLRTSSGRPREHTITRTRTILRRGQRR